MGADRKKYVMSVEMAMQREMVFRKRLENLKAEQCSNNAVIIPQRSAMPSLVESSTLTQVGFNQIPCHATQVTTPKPGPAPYSAPTPDHAPPYRHNLSRAHAPPHRPNPLHLAITQPSRPARQAHHQRKPPIHFQAKRLKVYSPEYFYCDLCKIECNSEISFRMHLKGHKHKSILRNLQANKVVGGTTMSEASDKLFCELCGIWCPDTNAFTLHLNGKNHFLQLHASEMKLKGPVGATSLS